MVYDAQMVEVKEYTSDVAESAVLKMTPKQIRAKALEGYFVRDAERNLVYCPQGEILRQKSIKRNGMIRYCNKLACKKCKCKSNRRSRTGWGGDYNWKKVVKLY